MVNFRVNFRKYLFDLFLGSGLTHFTISDLAPYLSRTLTSDFSHMPSGWAKRRKLTRDFSKFSEVFRHMIRQFSLSPGYQKNIKNLVLRNTRFENRHGMDLLDSLVFYGMELQAGFYQNN